MKDIRTQLVSNEIDSILSNAEHCTVHGEVQGNFHINQQQDAHKSLLKIIDIFHSHTKIDFFPRLDIFKRSNEILFYN